MLYFRMMMSMLVTLYTSRVVLNTLGVEDFGIYNVVAGVIIMFGFLNSAMAASTQRFLNFEIGKGNHFKLKKIFNVSLTIHLLIALIVLILAETIGLWFLNSYLIIPTQRMIAANWVYQFSIFSFILTILSVPYNATIIANEKMKAFAFVGIVEVILKLLIVYFLSLFSYDKLILYSFLLLLVSIIVRIIYGVYCKMHFQECKKSTLMWDKELLSNMGRFAGWNLFGVAAGIGYNQGVNILLNLFFGPTINAARGIAFQVQGAISNLVNNFQIATTPTITKHYAQQNHKDAFQLVFDSTRFSIYLLFLITIPFIVETEFILTTWLKIVPNYTINFTRLVIIDLLICSLSGPLHVLVQATGYVKKYQVLVSGLLLLNLPTSYLFLKIGFSPELTIFTSIFYSILALFLRLYILKKDIQFPTKLFIFKIVFKIVWVLFIAIIPVYILYFYTNPGVDNAIKLMLFTDLSILFAVYFFGINKLERQFVMDKINFFFRQFNINKR